MKFVSAAALALMVALVGCSGGVEAPTPTQDLEATVAQALPTSAPTATPDVDADHRGRGGRYEDSYCTHACPRAHTRARAYIYARTSHPQAQAD